MERLANLNLIQALTFYLGLMFLLSIYVRLNQYRAALGLVWSAPGRWPRLIKLVSRYRHIFLTWSTFLPTLLALGLMLLNSAARQLLTGRITPTQLLEHWGALFAVLPLAAAMIGIDIKYTFDVGQIDRAEMQKYLDQAELWLRPWTAPVVNFLTLGYVNPRGMVDTEVQAALLEASNLLNTSLYQIALQAGVRVAFGLSLWLSYAFFG